jgi:hypothetical protein
MGRCLIRGSNQQSEPASEKGFALSQHLLCNATKAISEFARSELAHQITRILCVSINEKETLDVSVSD